MSIPPPLLVVAGPTASGKSSLAVRLAHVLGGEIVSLDSVQVYRGLDIGSAKVTHAERDGVPHHLLDILAPGDQLNAAYYLEEARAVIAAICARGRLPILVGGTTMYLTMLLHGLAELPPADPAWRAWAEGQEAHALHAELAARAPETAARLHPNDRLRVIRALEALGGHAREGGAEAREHGWSEERYRALIVAVCWPRDELYARINARAREMLAGGLIEETRAVIERYGDAAPPLRALGYVQARALIEGRLERAAAEAEIAMETRRFAKRQMTFLRNEPVKRGWLARPGENESAIELEGSRAGARATKGFRAFSWSFEALERETRAWLANPPARNELWYVAGSRMRE